MDCALIVAEHLFFLFPSSNLIEDIQSKEEKEMKESILTVPRFGK